MEEDEETLSAAIALEVIKTVFVVDCLIHKILQQEKQELEKYRFQVATGSYTTADEGATKRKRIKKSSYFSDEEESE